jgi:hypothetical protein
VAPKLQAIASSFALLAGACAHVPEQEVEPQPARGSSFELAPDQRSDFDDCTRIFYERTSPLLGSARERGLDRLVLYRAETVCLVWASSPKRSDLTAFLDELESSLVRELHRTEPAVSKPRPHARQET